MIYACPKCGLPLSASAAAARCENGHSYDRAKEGYFHLLLGTGAKGHGDNKEMVFARRRFLDGGYYAPLSKALTEEVKAHLPTGGVVLDGGAGEGYYTDIVANAVLAENPTAQIAAFDISKDAVRAMAKKNPHVESAVAGVYHMPIQSASVDVALNLFAPLATEELFRVLKPGGVFIMAIPEREHLYGLKAAVYDHPYYNEVKDTALPGFTLIGNREIKDTVTLKDDAIRDLFMMTPYAYRTSEEGRARVAALQVLSTPIHFRLLSYRRDV